MKNEMMSLRRLFLMSIWIILIFSALALIRSQTRVLLSGQVNDVPVQTKNAATV